jgi:hypothetical protein
MGTSGIVLLSFEIEGRGQERPDQFGRSDVASFANPWLVPMRCAARSSTSIIKSCKPNHRPSHGQIRPPTQPRERPAHSTTNDTGIQPLNSSNWNSIAFDEEIRKHGYVSQGPGPETWPVFVAVPVFGMNDPLDLTDMSWYPFWVPGKFMSHPCRRLSGKSNPPPASNHGQKSPGTALRRRTAAFKLKHRPIAFRLPSS